jgi:Xaa-Pro dipeptidase
LNADNQPSNYSKHIERLQRQTSDALSAQGLDSVALFAGSKEYFWADDMTKSFRATPHFQHWLPIESEEHILIIKPGSKPTLLYYHPNDYWHEHKPLEETFWTPYFAIEDYANTKDLRKRALGLLGSDTQKRAWLGPLPSNIDPASCQVNPKGLVMHLDWFRSFKSAYELGCLRQASDTGVRGHLAAQKTFLNGGSERDIYSAYMLALGSQTALEAPYEPIIATDEKGAVLHYHFLQAKKPRHSLLIDAGARYHSYASDISRTYVLEPEKNKFFSELVSKMDAVQQDLCSQVIAGIKIGELHLQSHNLLADLLLEVGLLKNCSKEEAIQEELTWVFYPHGLGHMLGLQVHDVAGKQLSPTEVCPPADPKDGIIYKYLRNERVLEDGCVTTIEPGVYFIESLAKKWRDQQDKRIDFALFDELKKFGGIRIEDNIVCKKASPINLTRDAFARALP